MEGRHAPEPSRVSGIRSQTGLSFDEVATTFDAFRPFLAEVERPEYGNRLDKRHAHAILRLIQRYTQLASGSIPVGRYAADLDCGTGKSLSIACWCATVSRRRLPYTALIAATRVEELAKMKRRLMALGVSESAIGLWYSDKKGQASEPVSTGPHQAKQFLLVTHARISNRKDLETFNQDSNGRPRSVCFYDESLIIAHARAVNVRNLGWRIGLMEAQLDNAITDGSEPEWTSDARHAIAYLRECMALAVAGASTAAERIRKLC